MKDCNHEYFTDECVVCWFKLGHGVSMKGSPVRGDEGSEKHRQDCINVAIMVSEQNLRLYRTIYSTREKQ